MQNRGNSVTVYGSRFQIKERLGSMFGHGPEYTARVTRDGSFSPGRDYDPRNQYLVLVDGANDPAKYNDHQEATLVHVLANCVSRGITTPDSIRLDSSFKGTDRASLTALVKIELEMRKHPEITKIPIEIL